MLDFSRFLAIALVTWPQTTRYMDIYVRIDISDYA
jgi:hypothetical protein